MMEVSAGRGDRTLTGLGTHQIPSLARLPVSAYPHIIGSQEVFSSEGTSFSSDL